MTIETLLTDIMIETITLASVSAKDSYGKRTWNSASSITNCRVQSGTYKVRDSAGVEVIAQGKVYVPGSPTVTVNDKLTLPDSTTPPILAIDRLGDQDSAHHVVLYYGKA